MTHTFGPQAVDKPSEPDLSPPGAARQDALRMQAEANQHGNRPPYEGVRIATRGELNWIMQHEGWDGSHDAYYVKYHPDTDNQLFRTADLRGADLRKVALGDVWLRRADLRGANLVYAGLRGAHLRDAHLAEADLGRSDLEGAEFSYADFAAAHLREAHLTHADLEYANLSGARLNQVAVQGATLRGARMNSATVFSPLAIDSATRLGDVIWDNVALTHTDWSTVKRLGDELAIKASGRDRSKRLQAEEAAVRAYRQLSIALQLQGLAEPAARYAYRAQIVRRRSLGRRLRLGPWLFSWLLAVVAGYGYKLGRIVLAYAVVILVCAAGYYLFGQNGTGPAFSPQEALLISVMAFHGRVFTQPFNLQSPQAWLAAVEAIVGVLVEGIFVAMLVQRVFLTK